MELKKKSVIVSIIVILFIATAIADSFIDNSQESFDLGAYINTEYNGSSVVLNSGSITGKFTSQVFNASGIVQWNNISWQISKPTLEYLVAVDGSGAVYSSPDQGATWIQKTSDYGRGASTADMFTEHDYLYIIFSGAQKEVYKSNDLGVTWTLINNSFTNSAILIGDSDSNKNLYIATGPGNVWKSLDQGVIWTNQGDFNGGDTNNAKGIAINSSTAIFIVDGSGAVYSSLDQGATWIQKTSDYGGSSGTDDMIVDSSNNLYILLNRDIYKSTNNAVTWSIINNTYSSDQDGLTMISDSNDNFYIIDPSGDVYKSIDLGITWSLIGDFNGGATNDVKGFTNFIRKTNITLQVKNCTLPDCSDGGFIGPDGTLNTFFTNITNQINLTGQYFQYKVNFSSDETNLTSLLFNVTISYDTTTSTTSTTTTSTSTTTVPLNIELVSPADNSIWASSDTVDFQYNVTATNDLSNCSLILNSIKEQTDTSINRSIIQTFSKALSNSDYLWSIDCIDLINNEASSSTFNLTVSYTAPSSPGGGGGGGSGGGTKIEIPTVETQTREFIPPPFNNIPIQTETREFPIPKIEQPEEIEKQKKSFLEKIGDSLSLTGKTIFSGAMSASNTTIGFIILFLLVLIGVYEEIKIKKRKKLEGTKPKKENFLKRLFKKSEKTKEEIEKDLAKAGFKVKKSTKSALLLETLQELKKAGNIEGSAVISRDGLIIASDIPKKTGAEKFSATSALMVKSAESALDRLNRGKLNHIIINAKSKKIIATRAGNNGILVSLTTIRGNPGLILLEIKKIANKIEKILK